MSDTSDETLIYIAVTSGTGRRLEISGMLSVYQEWMIANSGCRCQSCPAKTNMNNIDDQVFDKQTDDDSLIKQRGVKRKGRLYQPTS